jgi:hypothetical protein
MRIDMIACDNPECDSVGPPEYIRGKKYSVPYGWWRFDGRNQGPGPIVSIDACSMACVTPAVQEKVRLHYDRHEDD